MTNVDINKLRTFERKILRKIYGPVREAEGWRVRYNHELQELIQGKDIVKFIKSQRIRWLGHMERMSEDRMPKRITNSRLYSTRRKGRPRARWMDNVLADLGKMEIRGWKAKAKNREIWRKIVEEAKAHQGL